MNYRIGTSGFSYQDWRGVFYPPDLRNGDMLEYYARFFDTVEINSTFYKIPHPAVFYHLGNKTPDNFKFIVKVNQCITHSKTDVEKGAGDLLEAVKPIAEANKLGGFLAQFPYSFKNIPENRGYLAKIKDLFGEYPLFLEIRNWTWNQPEIRQFLAAHQLSYVNVDQPQLKGLLPPQNWVTSRFSYIRFHGRNKKDWWQGTNETRYNYLYSRNELDEWLINISGVLKKSYKTYLFFNNHPQGKAVQNALMLKEMMENQTALFDDSAEKE